jgi:hypothetical protein
MKPPLELVPLSACVAESLVLRHGADKYGPFNWREETIQTNAYVAATLRHTLSWMDGEDNDPESGISHLAHARATLGILIDALSLGRVDDNRPCKGAGPAMIRRHTIKAEK